MSCIDVFRFSTRDFPFAALLEELFGVRPLEDLHRAFPAESRVARLPDTETDDRTAFHARFYERLDAGWSEFDTLYAALVDLAGDRCFPGTAFIHQRRPTFRVHLPGSLAVAEFHRDSDYNHPVGEINFMVPLTRAVETSAMWIESAPGKADYRPVNLEYGEIARFDGGRCRHGNKVNTTGRTRISFDFRLLSVEDYQKAEPKRSLSAALPFAIGGYYAAPRASRR